MQFKVRFASGGFAPESGVSSPGMNGLTLHPRVDRQSRVTVRCCHYSVPARLIGRQLRVLLRASQVIPGFRTAAVVHFVEISPALRERQQQAFADSNITVSWHEKLDDVPADGPTLIVANEFFDALRFVTGRFDDGRLFDVRRHAPSLPAPQSIAR